MSVIGSFKQVPANILPQLVADPELVPIFIYPEEFEDPETDLNFPVDTLVAAIEIDKTWQVIHFLLTGQKEGGEFPLANVIRGCHEIDAEVGYGTVYYSTAAEVKEVAGALGAITEDELFARFDTKIINEIDIYGGIWQAHKEVGAANEISDEDYILDYYRTLVAYYRDAAESGNGMFTFLT